MLKAWISDKSFATLRLTVIEELGNYSVNMFRKP